MIILLKELDKDNWQQAANLSLKPEQTSFAPSNLFHIAQARFFPEWVLVGAFTHDGMVGFAIYGPIEDGDWQIMHLMMDVQHQGKGYGTAVLHTLLQTIQQANPKGIWLSLHPENKTAENLYRKFGFEIKLTGLESDDEQFMYRSCQR